MNKKMSAVNYMLLPALFILLSSQAMSGPAPGSQSGQSMRAPAEQPSGAMTGPSGGAMRAMTGPAKPVTGQSTTPSGKRSGVVKAFTTMEEAKNLAAKAPVVLFFAADWCPTCQKTRRELELRDSALNDITVLIVDFDANSRLKTQFGVTVQHTFVLVDAKGSKTSIWNGGGVDGILSAVNRATGSKGG